MRNPVPSVGITAPVDGTTIVVGRLGGDTNTAGRGADFVLGHSASSILLALTRRVKRGGVIINEHTLRGDQTRDHVEALGRWFDFIHLDELPRRLEERGRRPFCLLTFDDGKRSNVTETAPELERLGVPAVFYVPTAFLTDGHPLWFDRQRALVQALGYCPAGLELNTLKQLPFAELNERLDRACAQSGIVPEMESDDVRPMSWEDARGLSRRGFTVGAHGVTHAILTRESRERAFGEIEESLAKVSSELGAPCTTFAFPNGNYTAALAQHALRCGASTVMGTEPNWVSSRSALWQLPRIQLFGGFGRSRIEMKVAVSAVPGILANPDGTGRAYRRRTRAQASKVAPAVQELLRCANCRSSLMRELDRFCCTNDDCGMQFPIVGGIPVLINDQKSLFSRADFVSRKRTTMDLARGRFIRAVDAWLPKLSRNVKSKENYRWFGELLLRRSSKPVVLVIGGSILGRGMEELISEPKIQLVETDVSFGPRTQLICDGHGLPFESNAFDGVIAQGVLQYLVDPSQCIQEIERVLKPDGLVYAESAFMQPVVQGRYDFTRFTHLGLRRLFRRFEEVHSGAGCGPGMALAYSCQFFLLSLVRARWLRRLMYIFARLTLFWLKYLDGYLIDRPGTYDTAASFYFMGRKSDKTLSDRDLVALYRGAQ